MRIVIKGTVQGVGFRPAVYRTAVSLGLRGTVCNNGSCVTVDIDDGKGFLDKFLDNLPPLAKIESLETEEYIVPDDVKGFTIIESNPGSKDGFSIPTDTAVCPECLKDMFEGRRKGYPFTTCTDCGPRFTLLRSLPYDRQRTAMDEFPKCPECGREYNDPDNRRLHHQTVCCPECGPSYTFVDKDGNRYTEDPIKRFSEVMKDGGIGIIKSWGGMHICCILSETKHMREWYHREQKPFAIMVRDMESAKKYCNPTPAEESALTSSNRPIVLVQKKYNAFTNIISPGLDNIGVFLPYTGVQHLLFDMMDEDALIMTSANVPGEPMILDNEEIMTMGADAYLLHNQEIVNRADDSVVRLKEKDLFYIRKSRGAIPSYLEVPMKGHVVAVGAQENLAGAVCANGRIYPTQHIGNGEGIGVPEYLSEAIRFQMSLIGCEPTVIAEDLHPAYLNRKFVRELAEEKGAEIIDVQHHWAHVSSLMVDRGNLEHLTALALDGTGHGEDKAAWGGEVLSCDYSDYNRLAHLEYIPLLGGQKALYDLKRLRLAIDLMNGDGNNTSFTDQEADILSKMMPRSVKTSSFGRLLDSLSVYLGVCDRRTYDGEPAMKLESLLSKGKLVEGFETETEGGVIKTAHLFSKIDIKQRKEDVAYSIVYNVLEEMVSSAVPECDGALGITGGVSYDVPIVSMAENIASKHGLKLLWHTKVPNGDGGISTGQAAIALRK